MLAAADMLQGWDPQAADMANVVSIHNSVNERVWQHILAWEALHCSECAQPRLKKFQGKPNEYSPKARLLNFLVSAEGCTTDFRRRQQW